MGSEASMDATAVDTDKDGVVEGSPVIGYFVSAVKANAVFRI